jgi:hypothetical protein
MNKWTKHNQRLENDKGVAILRIRTNGYGGHQIWSEDRDRCILAGAHDMYDFMSRLVRGDFENLSEAIVVAEGVLDEIDNPTDPVSQDSPR